ncbi:MAG: hypothetical protein FJ096_05170 [Deltaproteobacteria bacterium]|nr:hypothetical protein [Deltaproteobacteria bacterium]
MTEAMYLRVLERAEAQTPKKGPAKLPEDRTITLYVAGNGASITVANVVELALADGIIEARNRKGELFVLGLADVLAAAVHTSDERGTGRRAGFVG